MNCSPPKYISIQIWKMWSYFEKEYLQIQWRYHLGIRPSWWGWALSLIISVPFREQKGRENVAVALLLDGGFIVLGLCAITVITWLGNCPQFPLFSFLSSSDQRWNPHLLQWKCRVLTTGLPGKPHTFSSLVSLKCLILLLLYKHLQ